MLMSITIFCMPPPPKKNIFISSLLNQLYMTIYRVGEAKRITTDLQREAQGQPAGQELGGGVQL